MTLVDWIKNWLTQAFLPEKWAGPLATLATFLLLVLIGAFAFFVARRLVLTGIRRLVIRSRTQWDDRLLHNKFFSRLAHIFPALVIQGLAPLMFPARDQLEALILKATNIYLVVMLVLAFFSLLKTIEYFLSRTDGLKDQPIGSYFQLGRIVVALVGGILTLSLALDKSPLFFLSTFGAMTAIILLIFRDTILGFVASIQIAANDMVHIGDWVEMPKYGANGDVIQITLATIKVRNFDKTISHIPTYAFISESFRNWQGMKKAGGRRIMRAIYLKQSSIRFCSPEDLEKFGQVELIHNYLQRKAKEIEQHNQEQQVDKSLLLNGRNLTNLGLFREYAEAYLRQLPYIHRGPDMLMMVRPLDPTPQGLPLQIYCFTNDTQWVSYEKMQADVFDHLLASVAFFDLEIFEYPSGSDLSYLSTLFEPAK